MPVKSQSFLSCDLRSSSSGFSLLEILIAAGVASMAAVIMAQFMANNQRAISNQDARVSFLFPKLLVQQTIRDSSTVICPELGFVAPPGAVPSPTASYLPVPAEGQINSTDAQVKEGVDKFFAPRLISENAPSLGLIASSSPKQFLPQMGFDRDVFDCEDEAKDSPNEICKTKLVFNASAGRNFQGILPPADRFPAELLVRKSDRKLISCKVTGAGVSAPAPALPSDKKTPDGMMDVGGFYMDSSNHGPLSNTDPNPAREAHRYCNSQGKVLCEQAQMWMTCDNGMVTAPTQGFCINAHTANQARVREDDCKQKRLNSTGDCQGAYFRCCIKK